MNVRWKSCENCRECKTPGRWGCYWRTEMAMMEDKSPCLNWEEKSDERTER